MIARLTFINVEAKDVDEMKKIYHEEIIPVLKTQKGILGCWLLQPENPNDDYVSLTEWISHEAAAQYEASGIYKELVGKVLPKVHGTPVLKSYAAIDSNVVVTVTP